MGDVLYFWGHMERIGGRSKVIVTVIIGEIFQHPINAATKGSGLDDDDWCGGTAQVNCYD